MSNTTGAKSTTELRTNRTSSYAGRAAPPTAGSSAATLPGRISSATRRTGSAAEAKKPAKPSGGTFGSSVRDRQSDAQIKARNAAPKPKRPPSGAAATAPPRPPHR